MPEAPKYLAYYRVSTKRQGQSGLGLEAQKKAVADFLNGGDWKIVAEFTEVETGKNSDRPKLQAALAACRLHRAKLVIAKLDRLSRNAAFLIGLRDAGVDFVCADMPEANRLTVGVLALVAENEREMISKRTKDALEAAKRKGRKLGGFRGHYPDAKTWAASIQSKQATAMKRAAEVMPTIKALQASGKTTLQSIADGLNELGVPTATGIGSWTPAGVRSVLQRLK